MESTEPTQSERIVRIVTDPSSSPNDLTANLAGLSPDEVSGATHDLAERVADRFPR